MTYRRGTDLKHCPESCEYHGAYLMVATSNDEVHLERWVFECVAVSDTDTCPREQAEKLLLGDSNCGNCANYTKKYGICENADRAGVPFADVPTLVCCAWKERTNG